MTSSDKTAPLTLTRLEPGDRDAAAAMTFPVYRHLLSLEVAPRHPEQGDTRLVQPVGIVARLGDRPIGLALAEQGLDGRGEAEILSLFVAPALRGQGVGTALVAALEDELRGLGVLSVQAVYMTGRPSIPAVERILSKRGWNPPALRSISVRFTPEEALTTPWFGRLRLPAGFEVFEWRSLGGEERAALRASHERSPWITTGLECWRHDHYGFDEVSSLGLRWRGQVVGWVLNHRVDAETVRFTCSFMRRDLSGRARILPLYTESIRRLVGTSCRFCTFITPVEHANMVAFVRKRCAAWIGYVGETRGAAKSLVP